MNYSLCREHFKSNGEPKMGFDTIESAREYILKNKFKLKQYRCKFCGKYHTAKRK